jgi:flagellar motility protein MotE (MotC chaperone)
MSKYFTKPNLFTPLIVIAAFGFAFRAVNIVAQRGTPASSVGMTMPASAIEEEAKKEEPKKADEAHKDETNKDGPVVKAADNAPAMEPPPAEPFSGPEIEVLSSLSKRRDELNLREKTLGEREALLKATEQEVATKIAQLSQLKADMEKLVGQQKAAEDGRIASLVKIYENMKPGDAARIFDQLDMPILLDVIGRMNERKVSPVLAGMNPEKAKNVTQRLAEQRRMPAEKKVAEEAPVP